MNQKKIFIINFISLSSIELLNKLLPFLILPYIIRIIGIEKFGLLMFSLSIVQYLKSIVDYGFDLYSTREVSANINNYNKLNEIFSTTIFIKLLLSIFLFIIFYIVIENITYLKKDSIVYYSTYLMIFGYSFMPTWFFQGIEKMKYLTYVVFFSRFIYIFSLLFIVKEKSDFFYIPFIESISIILSGILSFIVAIKIFNIKMIIPSFSMIKNQIKGGWNLFILDFIPNLYNSFTTFLLGVFSNNIAVGLYSTAYKIASAGILIINILRNITYPYLNKNFLYFTKIKNFIILIGFILSLIIFIGSDYFIKLFIGHIDTQASTLLKIMSFSPFFIAILAAYGTNYFLIKKMDRIYRQIVLISSVIGFICSFVLVYYFNEIGAALTLAGTRMLISILLFYKYKKIKKDLYYEFT